MTASEMTQNADLRLIRLLHLTLKIGRPSAAFYFTTHITTHVFCMLSKHAATLPC